LCFSACTQKAADMHEEPQQASGPASATFMLVPDPAPGSLGSEHAGLTAAPDASAPPPVGSPTGAATVSCVNGWTAPERGSPLRSAALNMLRTRPGERFVVEEMRYFVGPEDAEVIDPHGDVERWYVKAYPEQEPRRRQRWLVRRAAVGSGVDAIAPYDSVGYGAATWRRPDAADDSFADPFEHPCQSAKAGEKCMGLPREVLGCLAGT
jgi:hypothetical protein